MKIPVLTIFLALLLSPVFGQLRTSVTPDKDSVNIGDPVSLHIEIISPGNIGSPEIDFAPLFNMKNLMYQLDTNRLEKTADVEILSSENLPLTLENLQISTNNLWKQEGINQKFKATILIGIYNIGAFLLENPVLVDVAEQSIPLEPKRIIVMPPAGIQDSLSLTPIKPIMEEPVHWKDYLPYIYSLLGIILFLLFGWYLFRRKNPETSEISAPPAVVLPPDIIALQKLEELKAKELWERGEIKAYQSQLTHIIREYLEGRFHIRALESTTQEILRDLHAEEFDSKHGANLKNILEMADLIKFAKAEPTENIHSQFMEMAISFVQETKKKDPPAE